MLPHARTNARMMLTVVGAIALGLSVHTVARSQAAQQQCLDVSKDPAGCQPSTFDTPMAQMPSVRVNRQGDVDPTSSEADAKAGAALLEKTAPPVSQLRAPALGDHGAVGQGPGDRRRGGAATSTAPGDGRGLGIAGNCIFVGHANGAGVQARDQHLQDPAEPGEAAAGAGRRDPGDGRRQSRASTIASFARSSTRPRAARTATSWFATPARTRSAGWRRIAST